MGEGEGGVWWRDWLICEREEGGNSFPAKGAGGVGDEANDDCE